MYRLGTGVRANFEGLHTVEESSVRIGTERVKITQGTRRARGIPLLAVCHTGVAADTDIQIDDESQLGHWRTPFFPANQACQPGLSLAIPGTGSIGANWGELSSGSPGAAG